MHERKTIARACKDRITTTTATVSATILEREITVRRKGDEIHVAIGMTSDPFGGGSIDLSSEQALALAERLMAAAD